jgi:hypothetical protein
MKHKSLLEQWMRSIKIKSFAIGAILLLGTTSLINNAYAHNHYDRSPVRMLFKDMDLTVDQRKEVKSIMTSSIKEGRKIREESLEAMDDLKKGTHKKLSSILSEEQMARFDKNSKRMENGKKNMRDGKMKRHGKGKKKRGSKRHKGHKKKQR